MISIPELPKQKRQVNVLCLFSHSSFSPFVSLQCWFTKQMNKYFEFIFIFHKGMGFETDYIYGDF